MGELNQYAISRTLGSQIAAVDSPRYGNFGLLATVGGVLKQRAASGRGSTSVRFTLDGDRLVAQAFEDVRDGSAPDCILWDKQLAARFERRCRELGLTAAAAVLNRRLVNVRKNKRRYAAVGVRISPTTRSTPHPSIVPQFAHAIEFALVRLRYRFGASIDDVLLDPELGNRFEDFALAMAPALAAADLRLGALYIRKTRHVSKREYPLFQSLDPADIENEWSGPIAVGSCRSKLPVVPSSPGLIAVDEPGRWLYVARTENLAPAVDQLRSGKPFELMANHFWTPKPGAISIRYIAGKKIHDVAAHRWELRLIQSSEPAFNWPIVTAA